MKVKIKKDGYQVLDINDDVDFNEGDIVSKEEIEQLICKVFSKGEIWETEDDKDEFMDKEDWYFTCVSDVDNGNFISWSQIKSFSKIINE